MHCSQFPLEKVTEDQLKCLCQSLWSWSLCDSCRSGKACLIDDCPWQRKKSLKTFFGHYKDLMASYESVSTFGQSLRSSEDLFTSIEQLRNNPDRTREQFTVEAFKDRPCQYMPTAEDKARAVDLAVKVMTMINCTAQHHAGGLIEHGAFQNPWLSDVTFSQFILDAFPKTDYPGLDAKDLEAMSGVKSALTAANLRKHLGLKFFATNDLRGHLKLDRNTNILYIYHHTAFLKENLRLTKDIAQDSTISQTLKLGALPRQVVLECLDSIQKVLFPVTDAKSMSILKSLTATSSFDQDCLRFESASIRNSGEQDIVYQYFGSHLTNLCAELETPTPRGWLYKWAERKSRARHVMLATLIGVIAAVILGILGLAVGIFQAWVSYQQWKHPVVPI